MKHMTLHSQQCALNCFTSATVQPWKVYHLLCPVSSFAVNIAHPDCCGYWEEHCSLTWWLMPTTPAQGRKTRNSRTAWLQTEMVFQKQTDKTWTKASFSFLGWCLTLSWVNTGRTMGWLSSGTPELVSHRPSLLQHNCIPRHLSKRQSFSTVKDSPAT